MSVASTRLILFLGGLGLVSVGLFAQAPPPSTVTPHRERAVEQREARQQKRIAKGVASGQLTPKEAARLERKEAKIDRDIKKAEADGKITKRELNKIEKEESVQSKRIFRKKHNAATTPK